MKEYDIVKSVRDLNSEIPKDTIGTVLIVYNSTDYEVEFVDEEGQTLDVITVSQDDITKYHSDHKKC